MRQNKSQHDAQAETPEAAKDSPGTALTLPQRAALAIGTTACEAELIKLVEAAKTITVITNPDGYKEANAARITLKNARTSISAAGKLARDDATAFSKAVIAEEKRLIAIGETEETRLKTLQDDWDAAIEAEKARKIKAEADRVQAIKTGIETLRNFPLAALGKSSGDVRALIAECEQAEVDEAVFQEHLALAVATKHEAITALNSALGLALAAEEEKERNRLAMIELETLREQNRLAAAEKADQARKDEEARTNAQRIQDEADRLSRELDALRSSNEAGAAQYEEGGKEAHALAQWADEQAAAARSEEPAPACPADSVSLFAVAKAPLLIDEGFERPTDDQIIAVLADHFDVSTETAFEWVMQINLFPETPAETLAAQLPKKGLL